MRLLTRLNLSVAAIGGIISFHMLRIIPSDPKNAWLLGFSKTRFFSLALILLITLLFIIGLINTFQKESSMIPKVNKIESMLEGNENIGYFGIALLVLILTILINFFVIDIPESNRALFVRFFPLLLLAMWLCLQSLFSLFIVFLGNPVKKVHFAASLKNTLLRIALFFFASFLIVAIARMNYPFQLEWIEDGSLQLAARIASGAQIYAQPTLEFVPFIYTPFYFYLSAGLSSILGFTFLAPRLISLLASIGTSILLYKFLQEESRDRSSSLIGAFAFTAGYHLTGAWLDIARVDSLYIFLTFAAIYSIHKSRRPSSILLSALLITLSIFTKQTAAIILAPILLHKIIFDRANGIRLSLLSLISISSLFILFNFLTEGWFSYFTLFVPTLHRFMQDTLFTFWTADLRPFYPTILISLAYFVIAWKKQPKEKTLFHVAILGGTTAASWSGRISFGGYLNNLLPVSLGLSVLLGLSLSFLSAYFEKSTKREVILKTILYSLCLLQFSLMTYNISEQIPTNEDVSAGMAIVEEIRHVDGEIYIPRAPYLAQLAGKTDHAHFGALGELIGHYGDIIPPEGEILRKELGDRISSMYFSAIILNNYGSVYKEVFEIEENYDMLLSFPMHNDIFRTFTGYYTKPRLMFTPDVNLPP